MREIKFRWYCKWLKKWVYGYYEFDGRNHRIINVEKYGNKIFIVEANSVWQFTGLLDKNRTEIYEGDIIEFNYLIPAYSSIPEKDLGLRIWVVTTNKFFHSCIIVSTAEYHIDNSIDGCIRWNIHQNPELINNNS